MPCLVIKSTLVNISASLYSGIASACLISMKLHNTLTNRNITVNNVTQL